MPTSTPPAHHLRGAQGAESSYKDLAEEPTDHALGRSRGGWTTKIHTLTDRWCSPTALLLSAGQAGDNPMLAPLIRDYRARRRGSIRLLGDKAYSHPSTRAHLRSLRIPCTIPERADQIQQRKDKGPNGGRPPAFDAHAYRHRNTAERGFNRLKHWRGIATRFDKYALTYLGGVTLAALVTYHRVRH